ncbi:MAG: hypothetical protein EAY79_11000 [Runella slithyformis]|nr:MAG: hypothetical protein EAY79_11000 [Runella slithyformis]
MIIFAQPKGYTTLDYTFEYHLDDLKNQALKGNIKTLMIYKNENINFHSKSLSIKLDTRMLDCHKYLLDKTKISEIHFYNSDGTLRFKRIYIDGLIQELVSYKENELIEYTTTYIYNESGQLIRKLIKDHNDSVMFNINYIYDNKNRLENVVGGENYNYKYIYDDSCGFYDIKYSEFNGQTTIHETRYNRISNSENLSIILQNEPKINFEDVKNLKKIWQSLSKFDNYNLIVFEQSKDLKLNEVQIESSITYNNDNQLVSKTFKTNNGTNDIYTFIYQDKKLVRQFANYESGNENFNQFLDYNDFGDLSLKKNVGVGIKEETYNYEYTYDTNKNWIEKKEIVNGKLFEITYRKIEYEE